MKKTKINLSHQKTKEMIKISVVVSIIQIQLFTSVLRIAALKHSVNGRRRSVMKFVFNNVADCCVATLLKKSCNISIFWDFCDICKGSSITEGGQRVLFNLPKMPERLPV